MSYEANAEPMQRAEKKASSRQRIVKAAARLMRRKGFDQTGIAEIMSEAGLTHGAFYAHFPDKTALAREALPEANEFREQWLAAPEELDDAAWLTLIAERYLSRRHMDHPDEGCPYPNLARDFAREGPSLRAAFEAEVRETEAQMSTRLAADGADDGRPLAALAMLVGAMSLARAVDDPDYADRILAAARTRLPSMAADTPEDASNDD